MRSGQPLRKGVFTYYVSREKKIEFVLAPTVFILLMVNIVYKEGGRTEKTPEFPT